MQGSCYDMNAATMQYHPGTHGEALASRGDLP